jgi:hypothetical protein
MDKLSRKSALVAMVCSLPLYFLFNYLGNPGRGEAAGICAAITLIVVEAFWDLRRSVWFWVTIASVLLLHVPLILLVPWTNKSYPGVVLLPIALIDFFVVYGCFKLVETAAKKNAPPSPPI